MPSYATKLHDIQLQVDYYHQQIDQARGKIRSNEIAMGQIYSAVNILCSRIVKMEGLPEQRYNLTGVMLDPKDINISNGPLVADNIISALATLAPLIGFLNTERESAMATLMKTSASIDLFQSGDLSTEVSPVDPTSFASFLEAMAQLDTKPGAASSHTTETAVPATPPLTPAAAGDADSKNPARETKPPKKTSQHGHKSKH